MSRLYLICFDVCEKKRLRQVAKILLNYGQRVQYSVFECHLNPSQLADLQRELQTKISPEEDRLDIYPLCHKDEQRIQVDGGNYISQNTDYTLI